MTENTKGWDWMISQKRGFWDMSFAEIWAYRHLLGGLVRRNFILNYQQTVIGPLWIVFQPIITIITYVLVFHKLVGISTGSLPPVAFYASGIVLWNFFNDSFTGTSNTFRENAELFSKVYFPRIIVPISVLSTQFLRFLMQLVLLILIIAYYSIFEGLSDIFSFWTFALPLAIVFVGVIGFGSGVLFSVLTAKYRDLTNLVAVGIRLLMFITPVIYPLIAIPENTRWIVLLNPLTPLFELFRLSLLGEGSVTLLQIGYSMLFTGMLFLGSVFWFNKQSDKLVDIV